MSYAGKILLGKVKFFDNVRGFGFITPIEGGADVFFHIKDFSKPQEKCLGGLNLELYPLVGYQRPNEGDLAVFILSDLPNSKGPKALCWAFAEAWDEAKKIISARPDPKKPQMRIVRRGSSPAVVWEGSYDEYVKKLDEGLPEANDGNYFFNELLATGWSRTLHPREWHPKYKRLCDYCLGGTVIDEDVCPKCHKPSEKYKRRIHQEAIENGGLM